MSVVETNPVVKRTLLQRVAQAFGLEKAARTLISGVDGRTYFSPSQPMAPQAPEDQRGRMFDYRVGQNINITPRANEEVSFYDLYALAEYDNVTRLLIETRKDQMAALDWDIKPVDMDDGKDVTADQQARVEQARKFFTSPDGEHTFDEWMRMLLEDLLVYDAPCVYVDTDDPLHTKFRVVNGPTIVRRIDGYGRTPAPPDVAYQQIIHGTVAWDYSSEELIYKPRNLRSGKLYGNSPVQQIILTVNIALRKQMSQLQYFSEGNVPDALISVPPDWLPKHIAEFQVSWDAIFEGNTAMKRHAKFVPGGMKIEQTKPQVLSDEFDLWLTKIRCYAFSVPPTAFDRMTNRGTAKTAQKAAEEEGLAPLMQWAKDFVDLCLQIHLGQFDLEFVWVMDESQDPASQVSILDTQLRTGSITIDEYREALGREPLPNGMGSKPMAYTAQGPVLLEDIVARKAGPGATPPPTAPGQSPEGGKPTPEGQKPPQGGQTAPAATQAPPENGKAVGASLRKSVGVDVLPLYVHRQLLNPEPFIAWAKVQGFDTTLSPEKLHVTIAFSKTPVNWDNLGFGKGTIRISNAGSRSVVVLGDQGAVVLKFTSLQLQNRWRELCDLGCSWDYAGYQPHITITYNGAGVDLSQVEPFDGVLEFGPEIFEAIQENWGDNIKEAGISPGVMYPHPYTWPNTEVGKSSQTPFADTFTKYSDDQPRDDHGQWTAGGGGGVKTPKEGNVTSNSGVTKAGKAALKSYAGTSDSVINGYLRNPEAFKDKESFVQNKITELDKALSSSTTNEDMVVYRGGGGWEQNGFAGREGQELEFKSYTSTTLSQTVAAGFRSRNASGIGHKEDRVNYKIFVSKGTNALVRNELLPKNVWDNPHWREREVLLPRSSRFSIDRVDSNSHTVYLRLLGG
jgi:hypothetical protein